MGDRLRSKFDDCWHPQPDSDETDIRIDFSAAGSSGKGWAGIYWQFPERNCGGKPGGKDLRRYQEVMFDACGERGGKRVVFLAGGIPGRYGDTLRKREIEVPLSRDWRRYWIDLRGGDRVPGRRRVRLDGHPGGQPQGRHLLPRRHPGGQRHPGAAASQRAAPVRPCQDEGPRGHRR